MAAMNFDGRRENRGGKPTTDKPSHHRCHTPPYWKKKNTLKISIIQQKRVFGR